MNILKLSGKCYDSYGTVEQNAYPYTTKFIKY